MTENVPNEKAALRYAAKLLAQDKLEHFSQAEGDTPEEGYDYAVEVLGYLADDDRRRNYTEKAAGIPDTSGGTTSDYDHIAEYGESVKFKIEGGAIIAAAVKAYTERDVSLHVNARRDGERIEVHRDGPGHLRLTLTSE